MGMILGNSLVMYQSFLALVPLGGDFLDYICMFNILVFQLPI
uniref:Uncharacterized protein n=1 Tax=Rhizophora mucronata TaxID=61149 RepID=A0A2P2J2H1_RHIMU